MPGTTPDPNALLYADALSPLLIDDLGWSGNWLVRANSAGGNVPEPATVVLFGAGLLALAIFKRH